MGRRRNDAPGYGSSGLPQSSGPRKRAENILTEKGVASISPADAERLVQELQMHQIELEMQNEELKRAQTEIAESREKYVGLYDFAPVGYFSFDRKGVIAEANLTGASLVGVERTRLIGRPFSLFVSPQYRDIFFTHCRKAHQTAQLERCELLIQRKGRSPVPVLMESVIGAGTTGNATIRSAVTDIAERKQMEEALRESEANFRSLVENSAMGIFIVQEEGFVYINPVFTEDTGYTLKDLSSLKFWDIISPEMRETVKANGMARQQLGKAVPAHYELKITTKSGAEKLARVGVTLIEFKKKPAILGSVTDLTRRQRAEEALRESEAKYRSLFENTLDGVLLTVPETGEIVAANPAACSMLGMTEKETCKAGRAGIVVQDAALAKGLEELSKQGKWRGELTFRRKDGSAFPVGVSTAFFTGFHGTTMSSMTFRDIAERKRMEEERRKSRNELELRVEERTSELTEAHSALKKSEERYKDLYDQASDMIFTTNLEGRVTSANAKATEFFSPGGGALVGTAPLRRFLTPESFARAVVLIRRAVAEGSDLADEQPWEFEARTADRAIAVLEVKARLIRENGVVAGFQGIARDITQRKNLEEERAKLSSAVERAGEGVFMLSLDKDYSYVNNAFCNIYGYTQEEFVGKSTSITRSDRDPQSLHDAIWTQLEAGNTWSGRQTRKRKDGSLVETETTIAPIRDSSGAIIHYVGVERDIGPQIQLEERLRQAQKMEAIGTLAGGVAHDFNNMLAVILGNAELALDDLQVSDGPGRNIEQIIKASKRARDLVKQILTFSKKSERGKKPTQLVPLMQETYKLLRGTLPSTIRMHLENQTKSATALADPSQVQEVLMNLAANAAHAMRENGGVLTIGIATVAFNANDPRPEPDMSAETYVKLTVQDTGTGMTEEVRRRVFEPFFTTKELGTGMGLAVAYGIVKGHGGAITVESKPGEGSTFTVFLPLAETQAVGERKDESDIPGGKERILLVDDEPGVIETTGLALKRLGYQVTTAKSGSEALKTFRKDPRGFDLIITDQTMPGLTGIDLAKKVLKVRKDLPVILFTGYSETVSPETANDAGVSEFVMKPIAKREVAETIRRVLDDASRKP
jgi:PAS domain S-box-containing protein